MDIIEGIYEMYLIYHDQADTKDSLKRVLGKSSSATKEKDNRIVMKF